MTDSELINFCNEYFSYDEETGLVYWKKQKGAAAKGSLAGWYGQYAQVRINKKLYPLSHVIWMIVNGEKPTCIDHINHNPLDNRIKNLRSVSHQENLKNMSLKKNNTSGVCGVSFSRERQKWVAMIKVNGFAHPLGRYVSFEDAVSARKAAEIKFGFHVNHGAKHGSI